MKIKRVIRWQNDMVMVFDENGQQVPDLQGEFDEVIEKIRAAGWTGEVERGNWQRDVVATTACKCGTTALANGRPVVQRDGVMTYTRHTTESCEPGGMKTLRDLYPVVEPPRHRLTVVPEEEEEPKR